MISAIPRESRIPRLPFPRRAPHLAAALRIGGKLLKDGGSMQPILVGIPKVPARCGIVVRRVAVGATRRSFTMPSDDRSGVPC